MNNNSVPKNKKASKGLTFEALIKIPAMTYSPTQFPWTVPSALRGLTSVFGMGTGVTPSLESPR